jgi:hypothetical protein
MADAGDIFRVVTGIVGSFLGNISGSMESNCARGRVCALQADDV